MLIVLVHSLLFLSFMISVAKVTNKNIQSITFCDFFAIKIQKASKKGKKYAQLTAYTFTLSIPFFCISVYSFLTFCYHSQYISLYLHGKHERKVRMNPKNTSVLLIYTGGTIGMDRECTKPAPGKLQLRAVAKTCSRTSEICVPYRHLSIRPTHGFLGHGPRCLAQTGTHHQQQLQPIYRLRHPAWHRHHGLHSFCTQLHA